jgi:broad specificity phosphatase PhoE
MLTKIDNVGEAKYGTKAWDDYWSKLDGDGELYWFDAHLTDVGKKQASNNNAFFDSQYQEAKMPAPEKYYVSPLYRCLQTANLTFSGVDIPSERPFKPLIKELLREVMGEHTCDKRSTRTVIHIAVPAWDIEPGFTEDDELWQADHRETNAEHDARTQNLLDDIFANDGHLFISFTSHSGAIASLLRVVGHRQLRIPTGGMMPMLLKATKKV